MTVDPKDANVSEDPNGANAQNLDPNANALDQETEVQEDEFQGEDLKELLAAERRKNARLLEENKRHKRVRDKAREELLETQGKKDELIESLRTRLTEKEKREEEQTIASAIAHEASKRNCEDWDFVYNLADTSMIKYDPENGSVEGVADFFDKAQKNERLTKFFLSSNPIKAHDETPSFSSPKGADAIDYKREPLAFLKACKEVSLEKYNEGVLKLKREGLIK